MVAFLLAAGLGTRLRPLTLRTPKALVRVGGEPLLAHVARRCVEAGASRLVVNAAHLGEQIVAYLDAHPFGVDVEVSSEPGGPLETGGGIKRAAPLLPEGEPVLVHNADVLTDIDLAALLAAHEGSGALATLAVVPAATDRFLVFDDAGLLGYAAGGQERRAREARGEPWRADFCGVHVLSPALALRIAAHPAETFSVMDVYLGLAREGAPVRAFSGRHRCLDVGTHERLAEAEAWLAARAG